MSNASQQRGKCYIHSIERYGCICFKDLFKPNLYLRFAFQIYEDAGLYGCFSVRDQEYIKKVAQLEQQDSFYRAHAANLLEDLRVRLEHNEVLI